MFPRLLDRTRLRRTMSFLKATLSNAPPIQIDLYLLLTLVRINSDNLEIHESA
jgi:hypothetical protein